jgi:hypothetical protein
LRLNSSSAYEVKEKEPPDSRGSIPRQLRCAFTFIQLIVLLVLPCLAGLAALVLLIYALLAFTVLTEVLVTLPISLQVISFLIRTILLVCHLAS